VLPCPQSSTAIAFFLMADEAWGCKRWHDKSQETISKFCDSDLLSFSTRAWPAASRNRPPYANSLSLSLTYTHTTHFLSLSLSHQKKKKHTHKHTITHASPYSTPSFFRAVGFQSIEFPARGAEGGHRRRQHPNEAGLFRGAGHQSSICGDILVSRHQSSICGRYFEPHGEANVNVHCSTMPRLSQRLLGKIVRTAR
jgi:hypothetical protein